jgi:5-methylcytosine-specific restriction endonuclease McrA
VKRAIIQRKLAHKSCDRRWLPKRLRAQIMLRQMGRCADCETRMILGKIVFDHRPPLAIRAPGDDANDPDRMVAICKSCDQRKAPRDVKEIARAKRLAHDHQDFAERMGEKVPGRPVPSKSQWKKLERDVGAPLRPASCKARP